MRRTDVCSAPLKPRYGRMAGGSCALRETGWKGVRMHKYKVGETVRYTSNVMRRFGPTGSFLIVRLLPSVGAEMQYRIKSATEPFERVVKEGQLDHDPVAVDGTRT